MSQHNANIATSCCIRRSVQFWGSVSYIIPYKISPEKNTSPRRLHDKQVGGFFSFLSVYYSNEISHFKLRIISWNTYYIKSRRRINRHKGELYTQNFWEKQSPTSKIQAPFTPHSSNSSVCMYCQISLKNISGELHMDFQHVEIWNI